MSVLCCLLEMNLPSKASLDSKLVKIKKEKELGLYVVEPPRD